MLKHPLKLSNRLMAIASFVEKGASLADIGTDHGYLPVYLAQNGLVRGIIASDISAGSLMSARRCAAKHGVSGKITFIAAPGLSGVGETDADTVVIAGLGGETIAGILKAAPWTKHSGVRLILQPQTKIDKLCSFLHENGYVITGAKLARDNGKFYVIIGTQGGTAPLCSDPLFPAYMNDRIAKARRALDGMKKSSAPDVLGMTLKLEAHLKLMEEFENANCE